MLPTPVEKECTAGHCIDCISTFGRGLGKLCVNELDPSERSKLGAGRKSRNMESISMYDSHVVTRFWRKAIIMRMHNAPLVFKFTR